MGLILLILACSLQPEEAPVTASRSGPPVLVEAPAPQEAQACYDAIEDRLEGPETPGECAVDADCRSAGCSGEVCVDVASAADLVTSCEVVPCLDALEACTCQDTRCRWRVRSSEAPPRSPPGPSSTPP